MLRTISTLVQIRTSSAINRLLYYSAKLPLIGRRIPGTVYASGRVKRVLAVIVWAATIIWGIVGKSAYLGALVYLPGVMVGAAAPEDQLALFLHIFLLLSFVAAGVASPVILVPMREKYIAVKLMRMSPSAYMRTTLAYRYAAFFILYIPVLAVFGHLTGLSFGAALWLAAAVTLWRVFCEYAHLKLFEQTGMVLIRNNGIVWLTIGISYAVAYAPLVLDGMPELGAVLLQWPVGIIIAAAGLFAALRLARCSDYRSVVDAAAKRDDPLLDLSRMIAEAQKSTVQTKASDYAPTGKQAARTQHLEGYAYLNALFFMRHRSLMTQPVYKRIAFIIGLGAAGILFAKFSGRAEFISSNVGKLFPYLILAMSLLTVGEQACRAMFYHCDHRLMRYHFYRNAVHRHFTIRLIRIMRSNLLIGAVLGCALTLTVRAAGGAPAAEMFLLWVALLALAVFFSVHHLFMYYIFQPYTSELNTKNPYFFIVNSIVSAAAVFFIIEQPPVGLFTWTLVSLTVLYLTVSLILVRRFGPRTFRVK